MSDTTQQGIARWATAEEGQFFERTFPAGARMEDLDEALLTTFAGKVSPESTPRDVRSRFRLIQ